MPVRAKAMNLQTAPDIDLQSGMQPSVIQQACELILPGDEP